MQEQIFGRSFDNGENGVENEVFNGENGDVFII